MSRAVRLLLVSAIATTSLVMGTVGPSETLAHAAPSSTSPVLRYDADSGTGKVTVVHTPRQAIRISWGDGVTSRLTGCAIRITAHHCKRVATHTFTHEGDATVRVTVGGRTHQVGTITRTSAQPAASEPAPTPAARETHQLPADWRKDMLASVNEQRSKVGASALRTCQRLDDVAQTYAATMADRNHYGHTGPDGESPWDRFAAKGYQYRQAAENIAAGYDTVADVQKGWIESPGHYRNMVDSGLEDVGFGYAYSPTSSYGTYWVQVFGTGGSC